MLIDDILQKASIIPSWISEGEKRALCELAAAVPAGGRILEVGSLYGGSTACLALANPEARITAVDEFSWSPIPEQPASQKRMRDNLRNLGIQNVRIIAQDSREVGPAWRDPLELVWIDGGHSYEYVFADLNNFGPHAQVIALHDYDNPAWPSIRQAVEDFLFIESAFRLDRVVDSLAILRRGSDG